MRCWAKTARAGIPRGRTRHALCSLVPVRCEAATPASPTAGARVALASAEALPACSDCPGQLDGAFPS